MGYPGCPVPPAKARVSTSDVLISVGLLVVTATLGVAAAGMGLFMLAFLDSCPPESCSVDGAVTAVGATLLVALGIGIVGLLATVVQLVRRKPGWPFAVATLVLCASAFVVGGIGYAAAVG
ncbi:hypothetical protein [Mycobacterium sp. URHB0021]|jgi:hypothetical protein